MALSKLWQQSQSRSHSRRCFLYVFLYVFLLGPAGIGPGSPGGPDKLALAGDFGFPKLFGGPLGPCKDPVGLFLGPGRARHKRFRGWFVVCLGMVLGSRKQFGDVFVGPRKRGLFSTSSWRVLLVF